MILLFSLFGCAPEADLTRREYALLDGMAFRERALDEDAAAQANVGLGADEPVTGTDATTCDGRTERNPYAYDPVAAELGRALFCEKLSGPLRQDDPFEPAYDAGSVDTIACDTCHHVEGGGADPRGAATSFGAEGWSLRNAPTVLNAGHRAFYSWNYVCGAMWAQIRLPLLRGFHGLRNAPCAVDGDASPCVAERVRAEHAYAYGEAFGADPGDAPDGVVMDNAARALDAYVRTLDSGDAPFDRYLGTSYETRDRAAMSAAAVRGAQLFVGRAACDECHYGPMLSDGEVHDLGLSGESFQTPPLRDVARTAPYMHDGSLATLEDVVWFYDAGGGPVGDTKDPHLAPLGLTEDEQRDLVAFLRALDGTLVGEPPACGP